jgi:hypothetical protein
MFPHQFVKKRHSIFNYSHLAIIVLINSKKMVARLRPRSLSARARATATILVPKTN